MPGAGLTRTDVQPDLQVRRSHGRRLTKVSQTDLAKKEKTR
jgi:hypothetical protein